MILIAVMDHLEEAVTVLVGVDWMGVEVGGQGVAELEQHGVKEEKREERESEVLTEVLC